MNERTYQPLIYLTNRNEHQRINHPTNELPLYVPTNEQTNLPSNARAEQTTRQPTHRQSTDRPTKPTNRPTDGLTRQATTQPFDQSANQLFNLRRVPRGWDRIHNFTEIRANTVKSDDQSQRLFRYSYTTKNIAKYCKYRYPKDVGLRSPASQNNFFNGK